MYIIRSCIVGERMKVIQFANTLGTGGIEAVIVNIVTGMSHRVDSEVMVLCLCDGYELLEKQMNKTIVYLDDSLVSHKKIATKFVAIYRRLRKLKLFIKNNKVEIVHLHAPLYKYVMLSGMLQEAKKVLLTVHNEPEVVFKKKSRILLTKYLIQKHNLQLIALHETMRQELNEMFNVTNTVVIRNGIDMERFNPERYQGEKEQLKESLGFNDSDYIVGSIGRLVEQKHQKHLVVTFSELLKQKPNAKLLLVGEGHLREELTTQIKALGLTDNVVMTGSRSDIPELLSIMDVFVFPSIYEGLSVVLVEAQAMGLKCVVSTAVAQEAHLTENYIPVGLEQPVEEWCRAILDESLRTHPVDSLKNYDMREIVKQLEELYRD